VLGAKDLRGAALALGVVLSALLAIASLTIDRPLLLNLGAGDAPYARGFRPDWERDGLTGAGATMFHWTLDGARLEFPVTVYAGEPVLRLRLARFSDTPAEITLLQGGRVVERYTQAPRGWSVRSFDLGPVRGPLSLQFRSESADGLGIALDWAEVKGAARILPREHGLMRVLLVLLGVPLLLVPVLGARAACACAMALSLAFAGGLHLDRLGALEAFARGAPQALAVAALLSLIVLALRRAWPDASLSRPAALLALVGALGAVLLLAHPFFYYPDVQSHTRFLAAVRDDPFLLWDPSEYQESSGSWGMREVAGRRVAFPYSPAFHALALPFAWILGDEAALDAVVCVALGASLLLVHVLARAAGLREAFGLAAQGLMALWPVTLSRVSLTLYPTLLGQAMDLLLLVHLARRYPHMSGARDAASAFLFLLLAQLAYSGSLFNTALVVGLFVLGEVVAGERPSARRLLGAYLASAVVVFALQYTRFLPVFVREILPHAARGVTPLDTPAPIQALKRFWLFYDGVAPALALLGAFALAAAPRHVRRLLVSVLAAASVLLVGRYWLPGLLRDVKEIELLAASLAVLAAAGLERLWRGGWAARALLALAALALLRFGILSAVSTCAPRLMAVGGP